MSNKNFSSLLGSIAKLSKAVAKQTALDARKVIGKDGKDVTKQVKEWYGVTMSVNGSFSFNYAGAGFTEILHVDPQAIFDTSLFSDQVFTSLNAVSLTSCRGKVVQGDNRVGKGETIISAGVVTVMIKVIGT